MRMVEHIIALKVGLGLDDLTVRMHSGDPPLFDRSSLDLVEAAEAAGITPGPESATYVAVKEPLCVGGRNGSFLAILPPENGDRRLHIDCAIDFRSAIGKQRVRFPVCPAAFRHGAFARTNSTLWKMIYCKTIGKLFADWRNLGYTPRNILIAGPRRYWNQPRMLNAGRSLEAVWHRAALDLLAALALIDRGRLAGRVISYKAGHTLDVHMIRELYQRQLLEEV
jgi:UDP-3-O-acyl-N-acetylglucosamine deacetylase